MPMGWDTLAPFEPTPEQPGGGAQRAYREECMATAPRGPGRYVRPPFPGLRSSKARSFSLVRGRRHQPKDRLPVATQAGCIRTLFSSKILPSPMVHHLDHGEQK